MQNPTLRAAAVLMLLGTLRAPAQARDFSAIDHAVAGMPRAASVAEVIAFIRQNASDDWERARGAYIWMTHNIAYDVDAFFGGKPAAMDAAGVFASGKSVCQGYSALFAAIAGALGLEVAVISGYAKAYSYTVGQRFTDTNHAWNAVKLDGAWHLMETTWGAGYVDGRKFVPRYTPAWFDMDPRLFVLNHFPEDSRWLLIDRAMTLADYEQAPFVATYSLEPLVEAGFETKDLLSFVARAPLPEFFGDYALAFKSMGGQAADLEGYLSQGAIPEVYGYEGYQPQLVEYPKKGCLAAGAKYRFAFRLSGCQRAAVVSGGQFTFLAKNGDLFSGEAAAAPGQVWLAAEISSEGTFSFWPLVIWQAK